MRRMDLERFTPDTCLAVLKAFISNCHFSLSRKLITPVCKSNEASRKP